MSREWSIRPLLPGEGDAAARLVRDSLSSRLRPLTIWASPRAGSYVESILLGALPEQARAFFLLEWRGGAEGVAALRLVAGSIFLDHLYLRPWLRGRGLGSRLLAGAAAHYLERHSPQLARRGKIALDVFSRNSLALAWYASLGFVGRERRGWWVAEPTAATPASGSQAIAKGLEDADLQHRAWGFSSFFAATSGGERYEVGRLHAPYFRLTQARAADDPELQALLQALDPRARLLVIGPGVLPAPWRRVASSLRLESDAARLLELLEARLIRALPRSA